MVPKAMNNYLALLRERRKISRVYRAHQGAGLELAELLRDRRHKALYMRLARQYDGGLLLSLAKDVALRKGVRNRGAYFMRLLQESGRKPRPLPRARPGKIQLPLSLRRRRAKHK